MLGSHRQLASDKRPFPKTRRATATRELFFALLTVGLFVASATAGPFTELVVFGDSLSDVGNLQSALGSYPGPYYYNGRFSNGPVYAESLSVGLGLGTSVRRTAGGDNFAYGGAKTSGTSFPSSLFVKDVDDQVTQFLNSRTADPNALFLIFGGANDLIGGQTNVSVPVNRLATDIGRLVSAGARQFLVFNLPLLGYTPRFNGDPNTLATYNTRTQQFNASLATMLNGLEASNPALTVFRLDVASLFNEALADPQSFGLTNVTAAAAPGLQPGATSYNNSLIAPNANEYLFWDDLHPTATVHAILSQRALSLFGTPGDYNRDEVVDAADYAVWRKGIDVATEYDEWSAHFGEIATGAGAGGFSVASGASVPEPRASAPVLAIAILLTGCAYRRNRRSLWWFHCRRVCS